MVFWHHQSTVDCARKAAGGLMELVRGVVEGELSNGMALIRPPGHHAEAHHARGFCVLNNVAVAAAYARNQLVRFDLYYLLYI
jgi:acetoin utilization deacetylase AcuC-like enzyme